MVGALLGLSVAAAPAVGVAPPPAGYFAEIAGSKTSSVTSPPGDLQTFQDVSGQTVTVGAKRPTGSVTNIPVKAPGVSDLVYLSDVVNSVKYSTIRKLPAGGTYTLSAPLEINGKSDLDIDFSGSTIIFNSIRFAGGGKTSGLFVNNSQRIRVRNLKITHSPPANTPLWSVGVVKGPPGARYIDLGTKSLAANHPLVAVSTIGVGTPPSNWNPADPTNPATPWAGWNPTTPWMWDKQADFIEDYNLGGITITGSTSQTHPNLDQFAGRAVLVRHVVYGDAPVDVYNSSDVSIEGVDVTRAPGIGFAFALGRGHRLTGSTLKRALNGATTDLISGTADGVHLVQTRGDALITGNTIEYQGDDGINVHGSLSRMIPPANSSQTQLTVASADPKFDRATVGQNAIFYSATMQRLGTAPILGRPTATTMTFASAVPLQTLWITVRELIPSRVYVANNNFRDNRGRGMLFLGANATFTGNTVERIPSSGFFALTDARQSNGFGEGPGIVNAIISNNVFKNVLGGAPFPYFSTYGELYVGDSIKNVSGTVLDPTHYLHNDVRASGNWFRDFQAVTPPVFTSSSVTPSTFTKAGNLIMMNRSHHGTSFLHDVIFPGYRAANMVDEGQLGWAFLEGPTATTHAVYECAYAAGAQHMISQQANCEGADPAGRLIGYLNNPAVIGSGPALYRCVWTATGDHMMSQSSTCEGAPQNDGISGYAAAP